METKITNMQFGNFRTFETTLSGRPLVIETGKMCGLANGSCLVRYGETVVLVNATASPKPRDGIDFFPLAVDYEEKLYAVGRIPGSFQRREGRPAEKAILASRVIDRPIRPLFPKDMRNDVVISCTVLSVDQDNSPEIAAMIGTSIAISISDIPWNGPIGGVAVGLVDGQIIVNPNRAQVEKSDLALTVAGTAKKVVMIEAGANEVDNDTMYNAIIQAHDEIKKICAFIDTIVAAIGKPKFDYPHIEVNHDLYEDIERFALEKVRYCMDTDDKNIREERLNHLRDELHAEFDEKYPDCGDPQFEE